MHGMGSIFCKHKDFVFVFSEWKQTYDYQRMYDSMLKPAFVFDGRKILNHSTLSEIGFHVETIGKRPGQSFQVCKKQIDCFLSDAI